MLGRMLEKMAVMLCREVSTGTASYTWHESLHTVNENGGIQSSLALFRPQKEGQENFAKVSLN